GRPPTGAPHGQENQETAVSRGREKEIAYEQSPGPLPKSRAPRPRSQPLGWRRPFMDRRRTRRLTGDPVHTAPKGLASFWTRARRLLWSWWPWLLACLFALESRH